MFFFLRPVLITLFVVSIVVIGGLYFLNPESLPPSVRGLSPIIKTSVAKAGQGLGAGLAKGKDAQPAIMGIKTESSKIFEEDQSEKPIHQKALEYTQYQYCKIVVSSFESDPSNRASVSATPAAE